MKKLNQWIVLAVGIASLMLAVLVGSTPAMSAPTTPTASPVIVTNTPLPVQGTIFAAQTAGSSYSVSVANIPTVRIAPAPIVRQLLATIGGFPSSWTNTTGQLAVIEFVAGQSVDGHVVNLQVSEPSLESHGYALATVADPTGAYMVNALTKIYVPAGATLAVTGVAVAEVSGHLE